MGKRSNPYDGVTDMSLLYYDPIFLEHDTGDHPECAERLRRTVAYLRQAGWWDRCQVMPVQEASQETLASVHAAQYLQWLDETCRRGGGRIEVDTVVSQLSFRAARCASYAVCDAVQHVVSGPQRTAFCLVRPPGHHARPSAPMGFCIVNHIAVAAQAALETCGLDRVLVVDWDVHHGNGTQEIFWTSDRVGFFSIHRYPFYPGTGAADEIGAGAGLGYTCNVPIRFGTSVADYHKRFEEQLAAFADKLRPQLILVSAGFDAHRCDPIGGLGLEVDDYRILTQVIRNLADQYTEGRVVSCLEGGYHLDYLPLCVEAHLASLWETDCLPTV